MFSDIICIFALSYYEELMNYPLISEYLEAIKAAEDNFEELKNLRPVLDKVGEPVMSIGSFAVVFKMENEETGKLHAVKCFLKDQEGRAEAYRMIAEELEYVNSTFLTPIKYLDKELFVDTKSSDETEFPVLLMDWVEGQTLDKYIREHIDDQYELSLLAYQFSRLAMWLMPQPFAHGDLKPDNILIKEDGILVLVDYDGMYVPAMKGQKARELGSPDFRHPSRTEEDFDEHIDDFSLVSILFSLKAISLQPALLEQFGASDRLLFSEKDYRNLSESMTLKAIIPILNNTELASIHSLFILFSYVSYLPPESIILLNIHDPKEVNNNINVNCDEKVLVQSWIDEDVYDNSIYEKTYEDQLNNYKWKFRRATILKRDGHKCRMCGVFGTPNNPIEVHHRYYIYHSLAWQYYDDALISLCHNCHQLVHKSISPLCYIKDGADLIPMNFTPCHRCNGRGYFPEYKNIHGGICFHCDGQRYEELIEKKKPFDLKQFYSYDKDSFDVLNPIKDQNKLFEIFRVGKNYHLGINGYAFNIEKALENYRYAAINGYAKAQNNCGKILQKQGDHYQALRWFIYSAMQGTHQAQSNLKDVFLKGLGVIEDKEIANAWEKLSSINGKDDNMFAEALDVIKAADTKSFKALKYLFGNAITIPEENLSTKVSEEGLENEWIDEYGVKYSSDKKVLLGVDDNCFFKDEYYIPEGTLEISSYAFVRDKNLKRIIISSTVEKMGFNAIPNTFEVVCNSPSFKWYKKGLYSNNYKVLEYYPRKGVLTNKVYLHPNTEVINFFFDDISEASNSENLEWHWEYYPTTIIYQYSPNIKFNLPEKTLLCIPKDTTDSFIGIGYDLSKIIEGDIYIDNYGVVYSSDRKELITFPIYSKLDTYRIIDTCESIRDRAFCNNMVAAGFGEKYYYSGNRLKQISFPESLNSIGTRAFQFCESLNSIMISPNITIIGEDAFYGCTNLKSIKVDKNNIYFDSRNDCNAIIETASDTIIKGCLNTIIPNDIRIIGKRSFSDLHKIKEIILPNSLIMIEDGAFCGCDRLSSVDIPKSVISIGDEVFWGCNELQSLNISETVKIIGKNVLGECYNLTSIVVNENNREYDSRDNCNAIIKSSTNNLIYGCSNTVIPKSIRIIGESAFKYCYGLTSIFIPDSVTSIGDNAFANCDLTSVTIPNSVTTIGDEAFSGCENLTNIEIPNSVEVIGKDIFSGCYKLNTICIPKGTRKKFEELMSEYKDLLNEEITLTALN